jgi:hypothetical protein
MGTAVSSAGKVGKGIVARGALPWAALLLSNAAFMLSCSGIELSGDASEETGEIVETGEPSDWIQETDDEVGR